MPWADLFVSAYGAENWAQARRFRIKKAMASLSSRIQRSTLPALLICVAFQGCESKGLDVVAELPGPRLASTRRAGHSVLRFELLPEHSWLEVDLRSGRGRAERYRGRIDDAGGWFELLPGDLRGAAGQLRSDIRQLRFEEAPRWVDGTSGSVMSALFGQRRHIQARFVPTRVVESQSRSLSDGEKVLSRHLPAALRSAGELTTYRRHRLLVRGTIEFNGYRVEKDVRMRLLAPENPSATTPVALVTERPLRVRLSRFGVRLTGETEQPSANPGAKTSSTKLWNRADISLRLVAQLQPQRMSAIKSSPVSESLIADPASELP